jgi:hypothetical protein
MKNLVRVSLALAIVAFFLGACATVEPPKVAEVDVCEGNVTVAKDVESLTDMGVTFKRLAGKKAQEFVAKTGGADVPWLAEVDHLIYAYGVIPGAVVVGVYDKNGCKFGQALLPEAVVFGAGA